jgi:hypothetical protein
LAKLCGWSVAETVSWTASITTSWFVPWGAALSYRLHSFGDMDKQRDESQRLARAIEVVDAEFAKLDKALRSLPVDDALEVLARSRSEFEEWPREDLQQNHQLQMSHPRTSVRFMTSGVGTATRSAGGSRFEVGVGYVPELTEVLAITAASLAVSDRLSHPLAVDDQLVVLNAIRAHCDAREASLLAARLESGASDRSVESLLQKGDKTSKRTAKTRTRRAKAVKENPGIASKIESGVLSPDQADVIASAADKTNGDAARDEELIEEVAATPPDQAKKVADEWVRNHTKADDVQDEHDRQRRLRCVKRWATDRNTHVLALEGDETSIDRVEHAIRNRSKDLYRGDGGRDLPPGKHQRTRDQRNFDAAVELLTRTSAATGGGAEPDAGGSDSANGKRASRPAPRSTIVVTMTVEQATGVDPSPVRQVGGALLAPSVLEELFCGAELVGLVTDSSGLPLWLGRRSRDFSHAQWLALIAQDEGCTRCGAHYSQCHAHHIVAWNSPARGPTDIDNAALLCTDCHQFVHEHDLILVRDPKTGAWSTRAARPHEKAPKRPSAERSGDRRQPERPERGRPKLHERRRAGAMW